MKPLDSILPYSDGITVERPGPVGDYKVPDGRYLAGLTGRLVELFTDGVPTVCISLYLSPHTVAVTDAARIARDSGLPVDVTTVAEAVGSDVTNVVRNAVETGSYGAAAHLLSSYFASDHCLAVSEYTRDLIIEEAQHLDVQHGTTFARRTDRIEISYPAIDSSAYADLDPQQTARVISDRGLRAGGYVLFLSRLAAAKGVDDLIAAYAASEARHHVDLVIAGNGPAAESLHGVAARSLAAQRIHFLHDVDDAEKPHLMAGCAAFALPSKPRTEFVETFGIALVEKMFAGGGPVITTDTGGIPEAVGDCAIIHAPGDVDGLRRALDRAVCEMTHDDRAVAELLARTHALQFDRQAIFDRIEARIQQESRIELVG